MMRERLPTIIFRVSSIDVKAFEPAWKFGLPRFPQRLDV